MAFHKAMVLGDRDRLPGRNLGVCIACLKAAVAYLEASDQTSSVSPSCGKEINDEGFVFTCKLPSGHAGECAHFGSDGRGA